MISNMKTVDIINDHKGKEVEIKFNGVFNYNEVKSFGMFLCAMQNADYLQLIEVQDDGSEYITHVDYDSLSQEFDDDVSGNQICMKDPDIDDEEE